MYLLNVDFITKIFKVLLNGNELVNRCHQEKNKYPNNATKDKIC